MNAAPPESPTPPRESLSAGFPFSTLDREPVALAFGAGLLAACAAYRLSVALAIFLNHVQPPSLQRAQVPFLAYARSFGNDLLVVASLVLVHLAVKVWLATKHQALLERRWVQKLEVRVACLLLLGFVLILRAHERLLLEMETGLTETFLKLSRDTVGLADFFHQLRWQDLLFVGAPFAPFLLTFGNPETARRAFRPVLLVLVAGALFVQATPAHKKLSAELYYNPAGYFFADVLKAPFETYFGSAYGFAKSAALPGTPQQRSIQLVDPLFVTGQNEAAHYYPQRAQTSAGRPWNVIFFILESTGSEYIFDDEGGKKPMPMPFLHQLYQEGLVLSNHFTACNSSPSAAFAIFTGLYPPPIHSQFVMRDDASIPAINFYLGYNYDAFVVHPSSFSYSFPVEFLRNNGVDDLYFQENLPAGNPPDLTHFARNEIACTDFFMHRLETAREPFLGIYWSFAPHHPYTDYGPEYRIRPDLHSVRDLYYNNLRLVDTQLRRLFDHLKQTGLADRTVVVITGDHGEGFGQHPGVWAHAIGYHAEMYRVPMLFWQPKLIPHRVVNKLTTHPDILPTLLDLLHVNWNATRFQGESIFEESVRKYIFTTDADGDAVAAITPDMMKFVVTFAADEAFAYNLAKDPHEKVPLNEDAFPEQVEALLKFGNYQRQMMTNYNDAILNHTKFPPVK